MSHLAACIGIVFSLPVVPPLDEARFLEAIHQVEGANPTTVGRHSEYGIWQIKPITWRTYSKVYQRTASRTEERRVACALLRDILTGLRTLRLPESAYWAALAWRSGLDNLANRRVQPDWREYAQRAENVYASYRL